MKHNREDWNGRIVDLEKKIPEDEPVFLLRAQDRHAAATVRFYATLASSDMETSQMIVELAIEQADAMDKWPKKKSPDLPPPTPQEAR